MKSLLLGFALVLLGVFAPGPFGCSDGDNVQYRPVGQQCNNSIDCGTQPFECLSAGYVGGYCSKTCANTVECPSDSVCDNLKCKRRCTAPTDCRENEGYTCNALPLQPMQTIATAICDVTPP